MNTNSSRIYMYLFDKKAVVIYIFILLFVFDVSASENLDRFKKLAKKSIQHGKMIKNIKADVEVLNKKTGQKETIKNYSFIYRSSDNHWLGRFTQTKKIRNNGAVKSILQDGVHEQIDNTNLIFDINRNSGIIENKREAGYAGFLLNGMDGTFEWSRGLEKAIQYVEKNEYDIISIDDVNYEHVNGVRVILEKTGSRLTWIFDPSKQYCVILQIAELLDPYPSNKQKTRVHLKKNQDTGIWFPSEITTQLFSNNSFKWSRVEKYTNVILNEPVHDEEIQFFIPRGARITHNTNKEIYHLNKSATMEDIISGKLQSVQEQTRPEITTRARAGLWWRNLTSSWIFRIFLILALTGLLYIIISRTIKKVTSSSD